MNGLQEDSCCNFFFVVVVKQDRSRFCWNFLSNSHLERHYSGKEQVCGNVIFNDICKVKKKQNLYRLNLSLNSRYLTCNHSGADEIQIFRICKLLDLIRVVLYPVFILSSAFFLHIPTAPRWIDRQYQKCGDFEHKNGFHALPAILGQGAPTWCPTWFPVPAKWY